MAESGIRTPNLPLGPIIEVLGHADAGGGARVLHRQSIEDFVQYVLGLAGLDPSGVADLSTRLTQEIARAIGIETGLRTDLDAEETRALGIEGGLRTDLNLTIADVAAGIVRVFAGGALSSLYNDKGLAAYAFDQDGTLFANVAGASEPVFCGGLAWAKMDENGVVLTGQWPDGTWVGSGEITAYEMPADAYGTDIGLATETGTARLTYDDGVARAPQLSGGSVTYVRTLDGATTLKRARISGEIRGFDPVATRIRGVIADGQSLSVDYIATPVALLNPIPVPVGRALQFLGGQNVWLDASPVPEDAIATIIPASEFAAGQQDQSSGNAFMAKMLGAGGWGGGDAILYASFGIGGQPYSVLRRGGTPWRNLINGLLSARRRALAAGLVFVVDELLWTHGEQDEANGVTKAGYLGFLTELQTNFATAVRAITGQSYDPVIVIDQCSSFSQTGNAGPSLAQLQATYDQPTKFAFSGPKYMLPYGDNRHPTRLGYRRMREYQALASRRALIAGTVPSLRPLTATRAGAVVTVACEMPTPPLAIDTSLVTDPGNYGVTFSQTGGNAVTVQSVAVSGSNVVVTLSATPTGTNQTVNFAIGSGIAAPGPTTGFRCCIRDSTTETGNDGTVLRSYMPHASLLIA